MTAPAGDVRVLRDDDPACAELDAEGWCVVAESWGARLRLGEPPDLTRQHRLVERAARAGVVVHEVGSERADAVRRVLAATAGDFPVGPATPPPAVGEDDVAGFWRAGRVFGAEADGELVGITVVTQDGSYAETELTAVLAEHRGRGIGPAVKAASVIALADDGARLLGTGGAGANHASLAANAAVGYVVEERWLSYRREQAAG